MKKLLVLDMCHDCPWCDKDKAECKKARRKFGPSYFFPEWCPLPDAPGGIAISIAEHFASNPQEYLATRIGQLLNEYNMYIRDYIDKQA